MWIIEDQWFDNPINNEFRFFSSKKKALAWLGKQIIRREKECPLSQDFLPEESLSRFNNIKRSFSQKKWEDIAEFYLFGIEKAFLR